MKKKYILLVPILSGLLLGLSFPPYPFNLLAFIGFVPLLINFTEVSNKKWKFAQIYLTFFIYHSLCNWWIGSWQADTDPYLTASAIALALMHPFFFFLPFIPFFYLQRKYGNNTALWIFPFLWVSFEWLHSLGEFSYPWLSIGNTQIQATYWIQFIDIFGIWGASFLVVVVNILIIKSIIVFKSNTVKGKMFFFRIRLNLFLLLLIIFLPLIYSLMAIPKWKQRSDFAKKINVGIIQPAINPWRKWDSSPQLQIENQIRMQDSLMELNPDIDLMLWSETSIPTHINFSEKSEYNFLQNWSSKHNVSVMTGFAEIEIYRNLDSAPPTSNYFRNDSGTKFESFNSAIMVNPDGQNSKYRKMKLTPFAERLPYADYLLFMRSWFEWGVGISGWGIGREQNNLLLTRNSINTNIAPIICIESIYPGFVSNFANQGAELFTVITNDAWYDYTPGPRQHFLISQARAIENKRFVVRCANTGISGLISAWGTSEQELPSYKKNGMRVTAPLLKGKTLYTMFGDWFPFLNLLLVIAFFIVRLFYDKPSK